MPGLMSTCTRRQRPRWLHRPMVPEVPRIRQSYRHTRPHTTRTPRPFRDRTSPPFRVHTKTRGCDTTTPAVARTDRRPSPGLLCLPQCGPSHPTGTRDRSTATTGAMIRITHTDTGRHTPSNTHMRSTCSKTSRTHGLVITPHRCPHRRHRLGTRPRSSQRRDLRNNLRHKRPVSNVQPGCPGTW